MHDAGSVVTIYIVQSINIWCNLKLYENPRMLQELNIWSVNVQFVQKFFHNLSFTLNSGDIVEVKMLINIKLGEELIVHFTLALVSKLSLFIFYDSS